jgi:hypothetical protein
MDAVGRKQMAVIGTLGKYLGKYLWIAGVFASVAMSVIITVLMELLLKDEVTYDYLLTGLVTAGYPRRIRDFGRSIS